MGANQQTLPVQNGKIMAVVEITRPDVKELIFLLTPTAAIGQSIFLFSCDFMRIR